MLKDGEREGIQGREERTHRSKLFAKIWFGFEVFVDQSIEGKRA